ncbi:UTP--glucose-1-phosphate uridylyltransferase AglF [Salinigranum halophilum]|uniref:UTP--glucose-1-phosphate uridylyltransferase AglF n=1 Tax=Salinigranum halophilum TaxID=2565931 RepID=UPI0010A92583|nr:UTP--glucose-1-phosphate uridylyltransferase AglF [Salinigranum halophilum]
MKAVVLAAGEGTRLRPLTETRPKALVEVDGKPILVRCLEQLADLGADGFVIVVGYRAEQVIDAIGDEFQGLPVTYTYQRERLGLAHALLTVEPHVDGEFMLMLGDNVFQANLADVVARQRSGETDAAFLVEEVPWEEASRYGVCVTDANDAIVEVVEKPAEPTSNLVMTGFYTFSPAIFHACHLVQPSARGEYELPDAIDLLIGSGRTIDAIRMDGWRTDIGYPADREAAERRLRGLDVDGVEADRVGVEAADE